MLRNRLAAVKDIFPGAFKALNGLVKSQEKYLDLSLLTLIYISKHAFTKLSPEEQAFNQEILAW